MSACGVERFGCVAASITFHSIRQSVVNSALMKLCALHEMETYHKPNRMSCDKTWNPNFLFPFRPGANG